MKTPSNLPPGVTNNDIERQAGAFDEVMCASCGKPIKRKQVKKMYFKSYHRDCADKILGEQK